MGGTISYGGTYSSGTTLKNAKESKPAASPIDFLSAKTDLRSLSATLASQQANGVVGDDGYGTYTLKGQSETTNIFNLKDSSYTGKTINISAPESSTVIVNVAGTADSFNGGSINISGVKTNNVIFNFGSATSLSLSAIAFNGTILAPYAGFTGTWGQINGQLIANTIAGTTELHDVLFNGTLPAGADPISPLSSMPEPSTWILFSAGLLLVGISQRRLRRNS